MAVFFEGNAFIDECLVQNTDIKDSVITSSNIDMDSQTVTSVADPINDQDAATKYYVDNLTPTYTVSILNNQTTPVNVTGILFNESVIKGVNITMIVEITSSSPVLVGMYEFKAINRESGWYTNSRFVGDITGVKFSIVTGQLQYTSTNIPGWISGSVRLEIRVIKV